MRKMIRLVVICVASVFVTAAYAVVIVDYAGGGATLNSRAADTAELMGHTWNFSDTTALFNPPSPPGRNDTIYGGLITAWGVPQTVLNNQLLVRQLGFDNSVQTYVNTGDNSGGTSFKGMYVWEKTDFLNGADSMKLGFSAGDTLAVNFTLLNATTRDIRFVVKQGGIWYISNQKKVDATVGIYSLEPAVFPSWAPVNTADYSIGTFSPTVFTNIQAVGFYMDYSKPDNNVQIKFDGVQVNATAASASPALKLMVITGRP